MSQMLLLDLQMRDYKETWELQHRLLELRAESFVPDVLVLVEHPHVITMGRSAKPENILSRIFPVYKVERGGDVTYHGYGQLVGYPILDLSSRGRDIRTYVRNLERMLTETLASFGIPAQRIEGRTGVWTGRRKIASIGVAVRGWITFHGFALNVSTDLSCFETINPCGYDSAIMTTMSQELGREVSIADVKRSLVQAFSNTFETRLVEIGEDGLKDLQRLDTSREMQSS